MFCPKCGKQVESEAKFCASCGSVVGEATGAGAAAPPAKRKSLVPRIVGWLVVLLGIAVLFLPVPSPPVVAFVPLWVGFAFVLSGSSWIVRMGAGFVGAAAVAIVATFIPFRNEVPVPVAAQDVELATLIGDYTTNEIAANERYKGKVIQTSGVLTAAKNDLAGRPYVLVSDNSLGGFRAVECRLADPSQAKGLKPGDRVTVKGVVSELMVNVQVENCTVQPQSTAATAAPAQPSASQQAAVPASSSEPPATIVNPDAIAPFAGRWSGLTHAIQVTVGSVELSLNANPQVRFESGDVLDVTVTGLDNGVLMLKVTTPKQVFDEGQDRSGKGRMPYWIALERTSTVEGFMPNGNYLTVAEIYSPERPTIDATLEKVCGDQKRNCTTYVLTK